MILIMQNFGSNPKMSCKIITDVVIIIGFLYFMNLCFILAAATFRRTTRNLI